METKEGFDVPTPCFSDDGPAVVGLEFRHHDPIESRRRAHLICNCLQERTYGRGLLKTVHHFLHQHERIAYGFAEARLKFHDHYAVGQVDDGI